MSFYGKVNLIVRISGALIDYWSPIWTREQREEAEDIANWPRFWAVARGLESPCLETPVDLSDTAAWIHVARKLPVRKSTGVCGWSNHELRALPDAALADLAALFSRAGSAGFPDWLMMARVAVLGKVQNATRPDQSRPITVLSNLYRLWARVFCQQVIREWSLRFPANILGCLKGRSAADLAYWIQQVAESAIANQQPCSGFALDLKKAFNFLPRAPVAALLKKLGVPPRHVDFWMQSLQRLQRVFQVNGHLSPPVPSSTGLPEGDALSVVGMLAVAWVFSQVVDDFVVSKSYVDNWCWSTDLVEGHAPAFAQLLDLVSSLKMQIDWEKSYFWATDNKTKLWLRKESPNLLPPGIQVPILNHVHELGAHIGFNRRRQLGKVICTFESAVARLHKLYHEPSPMDVKAGIVQQGVWPHAFYGAAAVSPGRQRLHKLRSNAARAIVGRYHTLSSSAALHLLPGVQDPEVYLQCHQARQLHRAFQAMPDVAAQVLSIASIPGEPKSVFGPGTALRSTFGRLGWTIGPDGTFRGPGHVRFHIRLSSPKQITAAIEAGWGEQVQGMCRDRVGLQGLGVPDRVVTQSVFKGLKAWEQAIVARHVTGAFMSNAEKSTWSRVVEEFCPLCGQIDTKGHRIFHCPALQHVRGDHQDLLDEVARSFPSWVHLLVAEEHEDVLLLRLLTASRRLPAPLSPPLGFRHLHLFTESFQYPSGAADLLGGCLVPYGAVQG